MQKCPFNRTGKVRQYKSLAGSGPELENHYVLRLPDAQAKILREDIRQGQTNIKDRLFIHLDHTADKDDMRSGIITFDTIMYKAKLVDMPTIIESWKTTDGKNFYKTADICQLLMVVDNDEPPEEEETRKKKRDPNKVDKKYLWPHGYTPPLKNVRKRRFRKTMRKKVSNLENLDLSEIEKEVKRLLRTDNEAINIRWEVTKEVDERKHALPDNRKLNKQQLFGELSSSEEEIGNAMHTEDEDSRLSVEDSQSLMNENANSSSTKPLSELPSSGPFVTEFSSSMFNPDLGSESSSLRSSSGQNKEKLYSRLSHLESDLVRLLSQRAAQEQEIATIENQALKQRFLSKLSDLNAHIREKEEEFEEVRRLLA